MQWFGKCVKKAAQSYCGKVAAQIIKTYVTKAAKPEKIYVKQNKNCHGALYGKIILNNFKVLLRIQMFI